MRCLLTGGSGQIGCELRRSLAPLGEVIAPGRDECDLTRPAAMAAVVRRASPDVIVNAAAYTAVDRAEREPDLAHAVNGEAPGVLARAARGVGALLVHYSTDYVFDGEKREPYAEDDVPHPINAYGRSKLAGETAIREASGDHLILRTSWVYAARGQNFVRTILRLSRERDELSIVNDQVGAPTWARDIATATTAVIERSLRERGAGRFSSEILHITAAGAASWCDFAAEILVAAHGGGLLATSDAPRLRPIASKDYPTAAARPKNSQLSNARLAQRFGVALPDWRASLRACIEEMPAP